MTAWVVVPGAFRGVWSVAPLVDRLRAAGEAATAVRLTGMDPPTPADERGEVTLSQWVGDVVSAIGSLEVDRAVVLGHSQGGMVAAAAAERHPEAVAGVAFLDAPVPEPGERGIDLGGGAPAALPPSDAWIDPPAVGVSAWIDQDTAASISARVTATPLGPSLEPIISRPLEVPWTAAFCVGTPDGFPSVRSRRRLEAAGVEVRLLEAGHDVALTDPAAVVEWCRSAWSSRQRPAS